jgi:hypothetical protein
VFTDSFIYGSVVPYYTTYSQRYNLSDEQLGLVMATFALTMVPMTPIAGSLFCSGVCSDLALITDGQARWVIGSVLRSRFLRAQ